MNLNLNVEEIVREKIEEMDIDAVVMSVVVDCIKEKVNKSINPIVDNELNAIIKKEIESSMSLTVVTDDGWGSKKVYPSFEDLFKEQFQKKLQDSYKMKEMIGKLVKERVESLIKQEYDKVTELIVDTITNSRLVKK